jgi:hypothetical protein
VSLVRGLPGAGRIDVLHDVREQIHVAEEFVSRRLES